MKILFRFVRDRNFQMIIAAVKLATRQEVARSLPAPNKEVAHLQVIYLDARDRAASK